MVEKNPAALADWVRSYMAETSREENVDAFVDYVNSAIVAELPILGEDSALAADLYASTKTQFQVFLSLLEREKQELLLPPQAVDLALSIERRGLELGVLLKVYRVAGDVVWRYFRETAAGVPDAGPDRFEVLTYLWDHGGTWINEAIEQLIGVFYEAREAAMHGAMARRSETVRALLRGESLSIDQASADLGHPLRGPQTALVLWMDEGTSTDALGSLNGVAADMARAVGAQVLTVPSRSREVWSWLSTRKTPDPALLRDVVTARGAGPVVRVSMGTTADGIAGFAQSHREAIDAQRWATSIGSDAPLIPFADVELACLVAGNERGVRALIARELGDLAGEARGLDRVRETVAAFLDFGGNVDLTATSLVVHKNTVRYRLTRAEELIGHPLSERRTEISLALHCLKLYGDPA